MVNRAVVLLRYREPAVRWINEADPDPDAVPTTLDAANRERTAYLISDADAEDHATLRRWIEDNFRGLWEEELEGWYTDETLWPEHRTLKKFDEWFDVECHTVVLDTVGTEILDDEV